MNLIEGSFQTQLIEVLKKSTPAQRKDTLSKVPLVLAYSVPVQPEKHIVEGISKN